jgi:hypothetical protein
VGRLYVKAVSGYTTAGAFALQVNGSGSKQYCAWI